VDDDVAMMNNAQMGKWMMITMMMDTWMM